MSTAVAQQQRNAQAVNPTESFVLVKNLLRTSISVICYLRNLFPEECFDDKVVSGINIKQLLPKNEEAKCLINWMEKGVFDALEKRYLKTITFCICRDPLKDFETMIESYEFDISYPDANRVELSLSNTNPSGKKVAMKNTEMKPQTKSEITQSLVSITRLLITLAQTLQNLPETRYLTMKLKYYDEVTPADYEPAYFRAARVEEIKSIPENLVKVDIGGINTLYHTMNLRVRTLETNLEEETEETASPVQVEAPKPISTPVTPATQNIIATQVQALEPKKPFISSQLPITPSTAPFIPTAAIIHPTAVAQPSIAPSPKQTNSDAKSQPSLHTSQQKSQPSAPIPTTDLSADSDSDTDIEDAPQQGQSPSIVAPPSPPVVKQMEPPKKPTLEDAIKNSSATVEDLLRSFPSFTIHEIKEKVATIRGEKRPEERKPETKEDEERLYNKCLAFTLVNQTISQVKISETLQVSKQLAKSFMERMVKEGYVEKARTRNGQKVIHNATTRKKLEELNGELEDLVSDSDVEQAKKNSQFVAPNFSLNDSQLSKSNPKKRKLTDRDNPDQEEAPLVEPSSQSLLRVSKMSTVVEPVAQKKRKIYREINQSVLQAKQV